MKKLSSKQIVMLGLLIATEIILSRFFAISTPIVKISFAFLPIAIAAICYGPIWGAMCAGIADIIGAFLFPVGAFFPGFTLTAALTGAVYGLLLYRNSDKPWRLVAAVLIICIVLNLGLDTYWLTILLGKSAAVLLPARAIKCLIMIPIQILLVRLAQQRICVRQFVYE